MYHDLKLSTSSVGVGTADRIQQVLSGTWYGSETKEAYESCRGDQTRPVSYKSELYRVYKTGVSTTLEVHPKGQAAAS